MGATKFSGSDPIEDLGKKYAYNGVLGALWGYHSGQAIHKWHHYIPIYERYFHRFRNRPLKFLEIGVYQGGSLELWRKYFGAEAQIFGIDINPDCAKFNGKAGQVRIGSQDDPEFLRNVINEMGGVDIVLDDGSHHMGHIRKSLAILFPMLAPNGLYFIEDIHTAYWPEFGGGHDASDNVMNLLRVLADDMHHWYDPRPDRGPVGIGSQISGLHLHDSILALEKGPVHAPTHSHIGTKGEFFLSRK